MREHTPTPWSLGSHNLRAITKDAEGIADGCDAYMVAVASAHSLLSPDEAVANAAYIVKACNTFPDLVKALEKLSLAYVNLLEIGRDRIIALGGSCDPVDVMETGDPSLRDVREVLGRVKGAPDHG